MKREPGVVRVLQASQVLAAAGRLPLPLYATGMGDMAMSGEQDDEMIPVTGAADMIAKLHASVLADDDLSRRVHYYQVEGQATTGESVTTSSQDTAVRVKIARDEIWRYGGIAATWANEFEAAIVAREAAKYGNADVAWLTRAEEAGHRAEIARLIGALRQIESADNHDVNPHNLLYWTTEHYVAFVRSTACAALAAYEAAHASCPGCTEEGADHDHDPESVQR